MSNESRQMVCRAVEVLWILNGHARKLRQVASVRHKSDEWVMQRESLAQMAVVMWLDRDYDVDNMDYVERNEIICAMLGVQMSLIFDIVVKEDIRKEK